MATERVKKEKAIASFFDNESNRMKKRHENKGIPASAKIHISDIMETGATTIVDVGSGPGSVLLGFLEAGAKEVVGIDLSKDMTEMAQTKISEKGFEEKATLIQGSFLDVDLEDTEGVSLHLVLCCHPDRQGMLEKSISLSPNVISLTLIRDWKLLFLLQVFIGFIANILNKFRPFVHSQKKIDKQLMESGYQLQTRKKTKILTTSTYVKKL